MFLDYFITMIIWLQEFIDDHLIMNTKRESDKKISCKRKLQDYDFPETADTDTSIACESRIWKTAMFFPTAHIIHDVIFHERCAVIKTYKTFVSRCFDGTFGPVQKDEKEKLILSIYRAIKIFDIYAFRSSLKRSDYALIGCASMMIAFHFEFQVDHLDLMNTHCAMCNINPSRARAKTFEVFAMVGTGIPLGLMEYIRTTASSDELSICEVLVTFFWHNFIALEKWKVVIDIALKIVRAELVLSKTAFHHTHVILIEIVFYCHALRGGDVSVCEKLGWECKGEALDVVLKEETF